jgi:hypothetical protein
MPTTQRDGPPPCRENQEQPPREGILRSYVLHGLGQPADLYAVQVRRLWDDRYRVNVFVGEDAVSARIAHSYFLIVDDTGKVSACVPEIRSAYPSLAEKATGPVLAV